MENKNFIPSNFWLIISWPFYCLVIYVIGSLYDINMEFILYIIVMALIAGAIATGIQYYNYRLDLKKKEKEEVVEDDSYDKKWQHAKEKEDFFAMWAHQIKTPIAALNLLLQSEEPNIYECRQETFKIEGYVGMALNYLRFDNMGNDLVLESYHLEAIVRECVKKFSSIFIHKHLSVKLENLNYDILTDDKWLGFVLEQVLSNALKYTKEGGITISAQKQGEEIAISISDTGIGIRSEDLPRMFEKGFTGLNGRLDKKASGLGLYLSKGICDKLGHTITVASTEGKGTTVTIMIREEKIKRADLTKM